MISDLECSRLRNGMWSLQFGDHLYYSYDKAASQLPLVNSFIRAGLELGHQCIHVADDLTEEAVMHGLREMGVEADSAEQRGALRFLNKWQWRRHEEIDPPTMMDGLASLVSQGSRAGYSGTRIWVDMTWALNPGVDSLRLEIWETLLHRVIQGEPVIFTCSYNHRRLPASTLKVGENTHPWCIMDGRVLPNDRSRLAALFAKHAPLLRRLAPPSRPRLAGAP